MRQSTIIFVMILLCIGMAKASYMEINMTNDGNTEYHSVIDTPEQSSIVDLDSNGYMEMNYRFDFTDPEITQNTYVTNEYTQVTKRTENSEDILETMGEILRVFNGDNTKKHYTNNERYFLVSLFDFREGIIREIFSAVFKELEYNKVKMGLMERDIRELQAIHNIERNETYDCEALRMMMKQGVKVGECNNHTYMKI